MSSRPPSMEIKSSIAGLLITRTLHPPQASTEGLFQQTRLYTLAIRNLARTRRYSAQVYNACRLQSQNGNSDLIYELRGDVRDEESCSSCRCRGSLYSLPPSGADRPGELHPASNFGYVEAGFLHPRGTSIGHEDRRHGNASIRLHQLRPRRAHDRDDCWQRP